VTHLDVGVVTQTGGCDMLAGRHDL
jgi:hypothetical protein